MGRVRSIAFLSVVSTWFPPAFASTTICVALNLSKRWATLRAMLLGVSRPDSSARM